MINVASVSVVDKTNVIRAIITGSDRVANKVAARWLFANMVLEYDWLIRLQVLEGTAGVPQGTWWNKRERGLRMARRFLKGDNDTESGEGKDINELWFTRENTGNRSQGKPEPDDKTAGYGRVQDRSEAEANAN